jgi:hypothetical protein
MIGSEGDAIALRNKPHVAAQHILFEGVPGIPLPDDNAAVGLVAQSIQPCPESLDIKWLAPFYSSVIHNRLVTFRKYP